MALAFSAAARSIDMSRQVGAAIIAKTGEILAASRGLAPERFSNIKMEELERELIDDRDGALKECLILDSLEFGRMLHAEMCAISEAARVGVSLHRHYLYCTTFPCHNCAKHIIGVGLNRVIYLQPYSKSYVSELYPDSIEIDPESESGEKVPFRQFVGVAPARYYLFEKDRLKDQMGKIKKWDRRSANPSSRQVVPLQSDIEKFALSSFKSALERITRQD